MMKKENYTDKPITEFNENDSLYLTKKSSGYVYDFTIKFKSFDKSVVTGEILEIQPNNINGIWIGKEFFKIGSDISGSIRKCYTFGKRAHWFEKIGKTYQCLSDKNNNVK